MRISRSNLEERVKALNESYNLNLSVRYFNGATWVYQNGSTLTVGTTGQCYSALTVFVAGIYAGMEVADKRNEAYED